MLAVLSLKSRLILCETWSEFGWLEAKRFVAKSGHRDVDWKNWEMMAHKLTETKEMTGTELQLKILLLQKKGEGRHLGRAELKRLWLKRGRTSD